MEASRYFLIQRKADSDMLQAAIVSDNLWVILYFQTKNYRRLINLNLRIFGSSFVKISIELTVLHI